MRVTKDWLRSRVQTLNMLLERPLCIFNPGASVSEQNIGHLYVEKANGGYKLVEIVTGGGAERNWSKRMTGTDMDLYLDGLIHGISLRNAHIGAILIKSKVVDVGLTPDTALYSDVNVALLQVAQVNA